MSCLFSFATILIYIKNTLKHSLSFVSMPSNFPGVPFTYLYPSFQAQPLFLPLNLDFFIARSKVYVSCLIAKNYLNMALMF